MEFKDGRVLWDQSLPGMTNAQRADIYNEMNRVIAALHSVDVVQQGLADYGKPGNYFERQIGRWSKQYVASVTQPIAEMDQLMAWLPANMPDSAKDESKVSIVHGDYRLDNVMFAQDAATVIAVLDWELSTLGHPLADFSYHCMAWHIPVSLGRGIGGLDIAALGIPSEQEYMRMYCERTGLATLEQLNADWNFYLAYNMFPHCGHFARHCQTCGGRHRLQRAGQSSGRHGTADGATGLELRAKTQRPGALTDPFPPRV